MDNSVIIIFFYIILFCQIVLKMWWKCDKCKKKLEEEITFSSQFRHYVTKFVMFPDLSFWAKLWSLYLITLWWKCDENVMNWIWYLFFGSHHLKIPALKKTWCSFTMTMNNEPSILSYCLFVWWKGASVIWYFSWQ